MSPLTGKQILINAGPTREPLDPVRFITNHSSGKMGIALADAAADLGAEVTLVLGPVNITPRNNAIRIVNVTTAASMAEQCIDLFSACDIAILTAAVADFTPQKVSRTKIKKSGSQLIIELKPTIDIAAELGRIKKREQLLAGFALETNDELSNAKSKLHRKNLDLIVLNSLRDEGAGFNVDTNLITIIDKYNNIDKFELKSKDEAAKDILAKIISMLK